jgi:hypothetical protein
MDESILSYKKVKPPEDLLDEIWQFDPRNLENTHPADISKYGIALAQYLIFYKAQVNEVKVEIFRLERAMEASISLILTPEMLKKYKTKQAAVANIVLNSVELNKNLQRINELQEDLKRIEGMDKSIGEYIAMFKKELGRKEEERYQINRERH